MSTKNFFTNIYVRNLLAAFIIIVLLIFGALWWLNKYTHHGESQEIPDVKGLTIENAKPVFQAYNLDYQVVDSIFNRNAVPGTVVETIPPIGTMVKKGRTIYVTLNSFSSQLLVVPEIADYSQRQAIAILKSVGFENIQTKSVPGAYRGLALGLERQGGDPLNSGERVPINTRLTLLVSAGGGEVVEPGDSAVIIEDFPDESWF